MSKEATARSAMKLALEKFANVKALCDKHGDKINRKHVYGGALIEHFDVVCQALAEPRKQEPVGRLESDPYEGHVFVPRIDGDWSMLGEDLYTAPPTLSLAQRKPLTDMQVDGEWILVRDLDTNDVEKSRLFARAIEAAHGIKENT